MADKESELRRYLDESLSRAAFQNDEQSLTDAACSFFQTLFVEWLNFDVSRERIDNPGSDTQLQTARLLARADSVRVLYLELETLTRADERDTVATLARSEQGDWLTDDTALVVFHAPKADRWHLVTPAQQSAGESGDPVTAAQKDTSRLCLRRYTMGTPETNRSVAAALAQIDARHDDLSARIHEAFRIEPLLEAFYEEYSKTFETLRAEFGDRGLSTPDAKQYAQLTLTRLLCVCYLDAQGWFERKQQCQPDASEQYLCWLLDRYEESDNAEQFHQEWLSTLFFDGLANSGEVSATVDLPNAVTERISALDPVYGDIFEPTASDRTGIFLADETIQTVIRDFLAAFSFTATEQRPDDIDIAVAPDMLGTLYQSFLESKEQDEAGVFYTPRVEIDLICRLSLYEQLSDTVPECDPLFGQRHEKRDNTDNQSFDTETPLIELLFAAPATWRVAGTDATEWNERVRETLREIDLVDPACGCGAFLVGMRQVCGEMARKLGMSPDFLPALVTENFYGVDLKGWPIRIAKFRLWLSLVRDETVSLPDWDQKGDQPFNLVQGNALVPPADSDAELDEQPPFVWEHAFSEPLTQGGFDIVIGNPPYVRQENRFEEDRPPDWDDTSAQAMPISIDGDTLRSFVKAEFDIEPYRTSDLYLYFFFRSLALLRDGGTLSFVTSNSWLDVDYGVRLQEGLLTETEIKYVIENRTERTFDDADVNAVITVVTRHSEQTLSSWPTFVSATMSYRAFASPRTMQQLLTEEPRDTEQTAPSEQSRQTKTLSFQGERLQIRSAASWRAISLSAGTLWRLGGGCTGHAEKGVTDSSDEDDAESNENASSDGCERIRPRGQYTSGKWGKYTRAPSVFFELADGATLPLTTLGEECSIRRGIRTGANQFFYLPSKYYDARPVDGELVLTTTGAWPDDQYRSELRIPRKYWMHRTEQGWQPNLVLKSTKTFEQTMFALDTLELGSGLRYVLVIDDPKPLLDGDMRAYVEWGEAYDPSRDDLGRRENSFPASATRRGVDWYDISADLRRGDVLPMKNIDTRHVYWVPDQQPLIDDRLHGIKVPGGRRQRLYLAGILNSTYGALSCEVNGRVNLGRGALDVASGDHERILIPPFDAVDKAMQASIASAFETFAARNVSSIFEELGTTVPREVSLDDVADDRLALDRLVIQELLGLDKSVHRRVYEGTLKLVRERIQKVDPSRLTE